MSRFNHLFSGFFSGCMIIGKRFDEGRKRNVVVYALPNYPNEVGLYDGIDTWISPVAICDKDVQARCAEVAAGTGLFEIEQGQTRRMFTDPPGVNGNPQFAPLTEARPRARMRIGIAAQPEQAPAQGMPRKRIALPVAATAPIMTTERRRVQP